MSGTTSWPYDMEGYAKTCVERYCELSNKRIEQLHKVSTPCLGDHQFSKVEQEKVGELSKVCSQFILNSFYLARVGRPHILWSVNYLARGITKWNKADEKNGQVDILHSFCECVLFQDALFAGDLADSKINFRRSSENFRKPHDCSTQVVLYETDCWISQ